MSRVSAGLLDWARVVAHPGLYKKAKRRWAQSLPPEERARLRQDKLTNQRGLQDPGARRLGASARRKSTRRKSRRQKKLNLNPNIGNNSINNGRGRRPKSRKSRRQAHADRQRSHGMGTPMVEHSNPFECSGVESVSSFSYTPQHPLP